jgi:predicted metal-binding protein
MIVITNLKYSDKQTVVTISKCPGKQIFKFYAVLISTFFYREVTGLNKWSLDFEMNSPKRKVPQKKNKSECPYLNILKWIRKSEKDNRIDIYISVNQFYALQLTEEGIMRLRIHTNWTRMKKLRTSLMLIKFAYLLTNLHLYSTKTFLRTK